MDYTPKRATVYDQKVIIYWDSVAYVVQGIDDDIAAQGVSPEAAMASYTHTLRGERLLRSSGNVSVCPMTPMAAMLRAIWVALSPWEGAAS
jgi:hypothetical protein